MMVVSSGPSAGGNVWMAPLISMVAERSGRRVLQDPADRLAGAVLDGAGDGERGEHDGQVCFDGVAGAGEHGPGGEVCFGHAERLLDVPQVVVAGDHLGRRA